VRVIFATTRPNRNTRSKEGNDLEGTRWLTDSQLSMTGYRRCPLRGGCYCFTLVLAERWGQLLIEYIRGLRTAFREVKQTHPCQIEAVVILPDDLHYVWTLPESDDDF
jgi:hypothetical protein